MPPLSLQPEKPPVPARVPVVSTVGPVPRRLRNLIRRAVISTLAAEGVTGRVRVEVAITDDETIRRLKARYLGIDEATDVLSFPAGEWPGGGRTSFRDLGQVVIARPFVERQARAGGRPFEEELVFLVVHGVLHLLGYRDDEPEGLEEMRRRGTRLTEQVLRTSAQGGVDQQ